MKFTRTAFVAAAAFALATVATAASAAPFAKHIGGDTTTIQVRGGHGHGGSHGTFGGGGSWQGNRGLHRGKYVGKHRGGRHSHHRRHRW
jgi:hypothetical protein